VSTGKIDEQYASFCQSVDEKVAQYIFADAAQGIKYLHSKNIVNRDIKPDNMVFTTEAGGTSLNLRDRALIVDFTIAEEIPKDDPEFKVTRGKCSPAFEAPEA